MQTLTQVPQTNKRESNIKSAKNEKEVRLLDVEKK